MMEDFFQTINHITRTEEKIKVYCEPNFEPMPQVSKERVHEVSFGKYTKANLLVKTYNSNSQCNMQYSSNFRDGGKHHSSQFHKDQSKQPYSICGSRKLECYYCQGEHLVRDCERFSKDNVKYKLKTADIAKKYKDKIRQAAKKGGITVNEAAFSYAQESTYSMEQVEQLLGNLQFSDSKSD